LLAFDLHLATGDHGGTLFRAGLEQVEAGLDFLRDRFLERLRKLRVGAERGRDATVNATLAHAASSSRRDSPDGGAALGHRHCVDVGAK
jgi:hypothetical protein